MYVCVCVCVCVCILLVYVYVCIFIYIYIYIYEHITNGELGAVGGFDIGADTHVIYA